MKILIDKEAVEQMALLLAVASFHSPELRAKRTAVIDAVVKALEQSTEQLSLNISKKIIEQEPVAKVVLTDRLGLPCLQWLDIDKQFLFKGGELLYAQPQEAAPRKPITDEGLQKIWFEQNKTEGSVIWRFARAIEAAHGITGEKE